MFVSSPMGVKLLGMQKMVFAHFVEGDIGSLQDPEEKLRGGNSKPERKAPETQP